MNKVQKIFVIFAFLAISSQCLPSGSTNLFHKFANTPNHIMVTVTLDYALDSPYYLASLDLTNVAGITLFRSGAYGECSVRSGSSVSNILQAHLSNFVRVPCFNIGNVLSVPLTELSLLGSNSFQIIIKDISFANKQTYSIPLTIRNDRKALSQNSTTVSITITDDPIASSDLTGLAFFLQSFTADLTNLTSRVSDVNSCKFFLEFKNFEGAKSSPNLTSYLNNFPYLATKELGVNFSQVDSRSASFVASNDAQSSGLLWHAFSLSNTTSTYSFSGLRPSFGLQNYSLSYPRLNGARLWVYRTDLQAFQYYDDTVDVLGYFTNVISSMAVYDPIHYGNIWVLNITLNDTLPANVYPMVYVNFTNATHNCDDELSLLHDCYLNDFTSTTSAIGFKGYNNRELEVSGLPTYSSGQMIQLYLNVTFNKTFPLSSFRTRVSIMISPYGSRFEIASGFASMNLNRTNHGMFRFLVPFTWIPPTVTFGASNRVNLTFGFMIPSNAFLAINDRYELFIPYNGVMNLTPAQARICDSQGDPLIFFGPAVFDTTLNLITWTATSAITISSPFFMYMRIVNLDINPNAFASSRIRPYFQFNMRRQLTGTWDFTRTSTINMTVTNLSPITLTKQNNFETLWTTYTVYIPNTFVCTSNCTFILTFSSDHDVWLGYNFSYLSPNRYINCSVLNSVYQATCYFSKERQMIITSPIISSFQNLTASFWAKNPTFSTTSNISVNVLDDSRAKNFLAQNVTLANTLNTIPKLTNTLEFLTMSAQLSDPLSGVSLLTVNFSTFNQICTTVNTSVTNINQTCLGDRATCLASGNCVVSNNLDVPGSATTDSLLMILPTTVEFTSTSRCTLNNQLITRFEYTKNYNGLLNSVRLPLNVAVPRNTNHVLRCYDLTYLPVLRDVVNVSLTLSSGTTLVAQSSRTLIVNTQNFVFAMSSVNNIVNSKNSFQFDVTPYYNLSVNTDLVISMPAGFVVDETTFCQGYSLSYSFICLISLANNNQFRIKMPSVKITEKISIAVNSIKNPSYNSNSEPINLTIFDDSGRMSNVTYSLAQPIFSNNFANRTSRKVEYLYTQSIVNSDSTLSFTFTLTMPKNISGSAFQLVLPSSLSPASFNTIGVSKGGSRIEITRVYNNGNNLIVYLASQINVNEQFTVQLNNITGPSFTSSHEIMLIVLNTQLAYIQSFSSLAYPRILDFPFGFGLLTSNQKSPIVITAQGSQNLTTANHQTIFTFNGVILNSPKCYIIKNASNEDFYSIIDSVASGSIRALELDCSQSSSSLTFSNYKMTSENIIKGSYIIGDITAQANLVSVGESVAFVILSSSLQITGTPTFDITINRNSAFYDLNAGLSLKLQDHNLLTSLSHSLVASNLNNGELNSLTFTFTVTTSQNYLSAAILETANSFQTSLNLLESEEISCSVTVNSVNDPVNCYFNFLDKNIYIQNFTLSTGSNSVVLKINNIRNFVDSRFVGSYSLRIFEGNNGNLIYELDQSGASSSNMGQIYYSNNVLGLFDSNDQPITSLISQCKNVYGQEISIRDKNRLLINQNLLVTPRISKVTYVPQVSLEDVTDLFIFSNGELLLKSSEEAYKFQISGTIPGMYLVTFEIFNPFKLKDPSYVISESFFVNIADCLPTFTSVAPASIVPNSDNIPVQVFSSDQMPFDTLITVTYNSVDSALVSNLQASNPTTYYLPSHTKAASISTDFTVTSSSSLSYTINIYIGKNQDQLAATLTVPLTFGAYSNVNPSIDYFGTSGVTLDSACFTAQLSKVGRVFFIITNYEVPQSLTYFDGIGYQNSTLFLESITETWVDSVAEAYFGQEITYYQSESWIYSGVERERISGQLLMSTAGTNFSLCVSGLNPEETYNLYYYGSDIRGLNTAVNVETFQTQRITNGQAYFTVQLNRTVSLEELDTIIRPVINQYLSFEDAWVKVDENMIFDLYSSFPNVSIEALLSNPFTRSSNQYNFRITIPKVLSVDDVTSAIQILALKVPYLNTILDADIQFGTSYDIASSLSFSSKPLRNTLKLELLDDPFRGYSGDVVFPINVENVNKLHILVLKLSSYESYNMAYNNIPLSSEEIADDSFLINRTVNYRYTYDLSSNKLVSSMQTKDPTVDFDIDLDAAGSNLVDYSQYRPATIDGKSVLYVPVPFNNKGYFRVYITGEYSMRNSIYPTTPTSLPDNILEAPELADLLLEEVDNWKLLLDDSSIIAEDIKSLDGSVVAEIPNFLSVLGSERIQMIVSALLILCAFVLF